MLVNAERLFEGAAETPRKRSHTGPNAARPGDREEAASQGCVRRCPRALASSDWKEIVRGLFGFSAASTSWRHFAQNHPFLYSMPVVPRAIGQLPRETGIGASDSAEPL